MKTEVRSQNSEVRSQKSEVRGQILRRVRQSFVGLFLLLTAHCSLLTVAAQDTPLTNKFPAELNTADSLGRTADRSQGTLSAGINSSVTTFAITGNPASYPSSGISIVIDDEIILCTSRSSGTFSGCTRGAKGTSAASHNSGAAVKSAILSAQRDVLVADLLEIEKKIGFGSSNASSASTGFCLRKNVDGSTGWSACPSATSSALTETDDTNVTLTLTGTPAGALLAPVNIAAGWNGTLAASRGGTGVNNAGTFTNPANTTVTGGGTIALGGFTFTVPGTGTGVLNTRLLTSGAGLIGGGDLGSDRNFAVGAGPGITVNADDVALTTPGTLTASSTNSSSGNHTHAIDTSIARSSITLTAGAGLTGGGDLTANRAFDVGAGTGITVNANDVALDTTHVRNVDHSAVSIIAGAGLTGGGTIESTRTVNVIAGAGITVNADDVALTTPGTLTVSTANSASGNHTHAITSSSDPGAAASLLATNASGFLNLVRLNVDTMADESGGNLSIQPAGDVVFNPTGNDLLPSVNYDLNFGALSKKYLTAHIAELWAETLVAQDTIATIGGRVLVGPTTTFVQDVGTGDTTIHVKHNEMANGDRAYAEAAGSVEFFAVTSSASAHSGHYDYTVTRNLDGSGANQWYAGDALFNTGTTGDGFIDLYSVRGVKAASEAGPTICGNVRNSATYNDWAARWCIGNLTNGLFGYGTNTYGTAFGDPAAANLTIDATNGLRIRHGTTNKLTADTLGNLSLVGDLSIGTSGVFRSGATGFLIAHGYWLDYNAGTPRLRVGTVTPPPFAAGTISGLKYWFKADALTLNDNDVVTTWTDASGNGWNITQGTAANKPIYKTNIVNGKPVVRFDGSNDSLARSQSVTWGTVITVIKHDSAGNFPDFHAAVLSTDSSIDLSGGKMWVQGNSGTTNLYAAGGHTHIVNQVTTSSFSPVNTFKIVVSKIAPGTQSGITLGYGQSAGRYWDGDIAEVLVYDTQVSDANLRIAETYLAEKYNITISTYAYPSGDGTLLDGLSWDGSELNIAAGGGTFLLDADGMTLAASTATGSVDEHTIKWEHDGSRVSEIYQEYNAVAPGVSALMVHSRTKVTDTSSTSYSYARFGSMNDQGNGIFFAALTPGSGHSTNKATAAIGPQGWSTFDGLIVGGSPGDAAATLDVQGNIAVIGDEPASTPSITKRSDLDTGIFFPATNTLGISAGGIEAARFSSTSVLLPGSLLTSSPTAGIGYTTGAGGTVTQATSKSTGVTLNKVSGHITMHGAALAAGAKVSFVVTDSAVATTDGVIVWVDSGGTANAYRAEVTAVGAGSFTITVENITAGSLSEAPVIGFAIIKAVTS